MHIDVTRHQGVATVCVWCSVPLPGNPCRDRQQGKSSVKQRVTAVRNCWFYSCARWVKTRFPRSCPGRYGSYLVTAFSDPPRPRITIRSSRRRSEVGFSDCLNPVPCSLLWNVQRIEGNRNAWCMLTPNPAYEHWNPWRQSIKTNQLRRYNYINSIFCSSSMNQRTRLPKNPFRNDQRIQNKNPAFRQQTRDRPVQERQTAGGAGK